jgi:hypothetical protein
MSIIVFAQTFGGAIWLAVASTTFSSSLKTALAKYAPGISPIVVQTAGATGFRDIVSKGSIEGVIKSYNTAVQHTFYIAMGCAAAYVFTSFGMGWKSVKKEKKVEPAVEVEP